MRSRRNFIGGTVGIAALLTGCIGQLGSNDSDNSDSSGENEDDFRMRPTVSISIWPEIEGNEVGVIASMGDAETIIIEADGQEIDRISSDTEEERIVAEDVDEGTYFQAIAVYPNGDREPAGERCFRC